MKCRALEVTEQYEAAAQDRPAFRGNPPGQSDRLVRGRDCERRERRFARLMVLCSGRWRSGRQNPGPHLSGHELSGRALYDQGFPLPAVRLAQFQVELSPDDRQAKQMLAAMSRNAEVPLLFSAMSRRLRPVRKMPRGRIGLGKSCVAWTLAIGKRRPNGSRRWPPKRRDATGLWCNTAILRADRRQRRVREAWRRYAALRVRESDGLEDAVEAEATAMFLSVDPLGDHEDILRVEWHVRDAQRVHELLLSSPRTPPIPVDPKPFSDAGLPPPKGAYWLLDRPVRLRPKD